MTTPFVQYGYADGSANTVRPRFDEFYRNDLIHRLKELSRGTLNAQKTDVANDTFAECWSLDPTGNWKKFLEDTNGDGTWDLNQARTSNTVNEITGITESAGPSWATPGYNAAGNQASPPTDEGGGRASAIASTTTLPARRSHQDLHRHVRCLEPAGEAGR